MKKTYVKTFFYKDRRSRIDEETRSLAEVIDDYLSCHPNTYIKHIEHLWGDSYGAKMAVLFEEKQGESYDG